MSKFYFFLWFRWLVRLTFESIIIASILSSMVTFVIYVNQGMQSLDSEVYMALFLIFKFWFVILWSLALLVSLFRGLKYIFNSCHNGYKLNLLTCPDDGEVEVIDEIGYGDLVKTWRKWFMLIIWLVAIEMVLAVAFTSVFPLFDSIFDWFNIYSLYAFVLIAGYFSFIALSIRCKRVKIVKC